MHHFSSALHTYKIPVVRTGYSCGWCVYIISYNNVYFSVRANSSMIKLSYAVSAGHFEAGKKG